MTHYYYTRKIKKFTRIPNLQKQSVHDTCHLRYFSYGISKQVQCKFPLSLFQHLQKGILPSSKCHKLNEISIQVLRGPSVNYDPNVKTIPHYFLLTTKVR